MADMTREEAIEIFEHNWTRIVNGDDYTEDELNNALDFALADMKRVEKLEAENKRLTEGIEKVKAEIEALANTDFIPGTFVNGVTECKDIINKYLGE